MAKASTDTAPHLRRSSAHTDMVAPVVTTSSTSNICLPYTAETHASATEYDDTAFSILCARLSDFCFVLPVCSSAWQYGQCSCRAICRASSCAWSKPNFLTAAGERGTGTTVTLRHTRSVFCRSCCVASVAAKTIAFWRRTRLARRKKELTGSSSRTEYGDSVQRRSTPRKEYRSHELPRVTDCFHFCAQATRKASPPVSSPHKKQRVGKSHSAILSKHVI